MAYPSARLRPSRNVRGTGFGRVYNARTPPKQAAKPSDPPLLPDLPAPLPGPIWGHRNGSLFMSAAEQLEDASGGPPPRRDALLEEEAFIETQLTQSPAKT